MSIHRPITLYAQVSSEINFYYSVRSLYRFFHGVARDQNSRHAALAMRLCALEWCLRWRLDNNRTMSPTPLERDLVDRARDERRAIYERCEAKPRDDFEARYLLRMREQALNARKQEHISRIVWAMHEAQDDEWWPFFVTLTVNAENYEAVFRRGSTAWKEYHRSVSRAIGRQCGLTKREAEVETLHKYFAVVERGDKNGRLHIHVLHLCKSPPVHAKDPNAGRPIPYYRELTSWRRFWKFGYVTAVAVRTNACDIFARAGWRWPVERSDPDDASNSDFRVYRSAGIAGVACYIGKYIHKQRYGEKEYWRCRMSRNFGLTKIQSRISSLSSRRCLQICAAYLPVIRQENRTIPKRLLRRMAATELMIRIGLRCPRKSERRPSSAICAKTLRVRPELLRRTRRSATTLRYLRALLRLDPGYSCLEKLRMTRPLSIQSFRDMGACEWLSELWPQPTVVRTVSGLV